MRLVRCYFDGEADMPLVISDRSDMADVICAEYMRNDWADLYDYVEWCIDKEQIDEGLDPTLQVGSRVYHAGEIVHALGGEDWDAWVDTILEETIEDAYKSVCEGLDFRLPFGRNDGKYINVIDEPEEDGE